MTRLALAVFVAVGLVGCAADGGDDDVIGDDDDAPPFTDGVSTLSGAADPGYVDGVRGVARFANPVGCAVGPDGDVYVADFDNGKIRVVDASDGNTRTLIDQAELKRPFALTFADDGTLYVTTDKNTGEGMQTAMSGTVWKVDNGVATVIAENIGRPRGIVALPDGRLAISDYQHHVLQLVSPGGAVSPLAGAWDSKGMVDGAGARFSVPYGMALLDGKLVVADQDNHRIRLVGLDGTAETIAGGSGAGYADGPAASAQFNRPQGVAVTASGDIYVSDLGNFRIRRIRAGMVETVAGSGEGGYLDHDDRLAAQLYGMEGVCASPDGAMVYVPDGGRGEDVPYNRLRSIKLN